jgi:hypothetical protein
VSDILRYFDKSETYNTLSMLFTRPRGTALRSTGVPSFRALVDTLGAVVAQLLARAVAFTRLVPLFGTASRATFRLSKVHSRGALVDAFLVVASTDELFSVRALEQVSAIGH